MKTKPQLLLHPVFILSLICLLLNDLYWKYEFHNWLTGKLSDITGLFVLSVFLSAFFFKHRSIIYSCIVLFFVWWKTPLSQPVIDLINQISSATFHRTIDYTDYIAIPAVFAAHLLKPAEYNFSFTKKLAVHFISAFCLFAFCSTSIIRRAYIGMDMGGRITYSHSYPTRFDEGTILHKLDSLGLNFKIDSFNTFPVDFYGGNLLIRDRDSGRKSSVVISPEQKDTAVYFRIDERPYIAIYNLKVKDEIIPQVNIRIRTVVRSNDIELATIVMSDQQIDEYINKRSKTKRRLRKLVEEGLIRKLK